MKKENPGSRLMLRFQLMLFVLTLFLHRTVRCELLQGRDRVQLTVSLAVLCYVPHEAEQDIQVKFTTNSSDQVTGSIQFARDNWKWFVMAGCVVPPEASLAFIGIFRSFSKPPNSTPFYIQKLVIVEGDIPRGGM